MDCGLISEPIGLDGREITKDSMCRFMDLISFKVSVFLDF